MSTLIDTTSQKTPAKPKSVKAAQILSQFAGSYEDQKFGQVHYELVHPVYYIDEYGEINGWVVSATSKYFDNVPKMFLSLIDMDQVDVSTVLPEHLQDSKKFGLSQIQIIQQPAISFEFRKLHADKPLTEYVTAMFDSIAVILSRKINSR